MMDGTRPGAGVAAQPRPRLEDWLPPPAVLSLARGEVHVWRAGLDLPEAGVRSLWSLLSADERERATGFCFAQLRHRFVAGRGLLRVILGRYLEVAPNRLQFRYSRYGKPSLAYPGAGRLTFNLSHSCGLALFAVARERELGVDLERVDRSVEHEQIAARFFSPPEVAALRAVPPAQRAVAFFNGWTRKEAYLKGHGEGLSLPLDSFTVTLAPDGVVALLHVVGQPGEAARWSLYHLIPGEGFVGALAVEGRPERLRCWQWVA